MNTPRQDDNKAVGPQNAATKENPKVTGSGPSVPSKTIPPPNDTKEPCHCHYEPTPRWMRWLEAIGVIAVIAYAIITYCMWYEIQEQTKISRQQLEATERPWV